MGKQAKSAPAQRLSERLLQQRDSVGSEGDAGVEPAKKRRKTFAVCARCSKTSEESGEKCLQKPCLQSATGLASKDAEMS
eukprot:35179-Amphidinium_carterae.2